MTASSTRSLRGLTVKQAIALLSKLPDDSLRVLIDCPYCGRGNQITNVTECVVLESLEEKTDGR